MKEKLIELLSLDTESEILEFKLAKDSYSKDKLGKYFSALGNEANLAHKSVAYLIFGVNDKHEIVGSNISDRQLNEFKQEISNHISPALNFVNVERIQTEKGNVIVFSIPPAPRGTPISWKGHRYGRNGESLGGLNDFELNSIISQKEDWSSVIIENAGLEDLDKNAIDFAREQYSLKNPKQIHEIASWDDKKFLDKAKITIRGKITRTAIILLGKTESEHLINPATARITWILKDKDNIERDYEHFYCPLILAIDSVRSKIRNLNYRYLKSGTLFPEETEQYNSYLIRESLHNAIAHQDYSLGGKIVIVENEDGWLSFSNAGSFIPESVEDVVIKDIPEAIYRNVFLVNAMVNLNMIDTIGSGIKKMFNIQRRKFFPLPEYDLSNDKVSVTIYGKILNFDYAQRLASIPDLSLNEIISLDKVAKGKEISKEEAKILQNRGLIEGRRPNYHISSNVAIATGEKAKYMKNRGIDDLYCQKMIIEYLDKFGKGSRKDIEDLLLDKLPDVLDNAQKKNKIKNNLQYLRRGGEIEIKNRTWILSKNSKKI